MDARHVVDFNPGSALGLSLSLLPRRVAELGAQALIHRLNFLHPGLRERLTEAEGKSFALALSDMPFNALLQIRQGRLTLVLRSKHSPLVADVKIHGVSETYLALLEGRADGDALFFSRDLRVEGDMEALLILRNALDNERIDIRDTVFSVFGPFSGIVSRAARPVEALGMRFARDVRRLLRET